MAIRFSCECGKRFTAKDEYAGRRSRCPSCGRDVVIPSRTDPERSGPPSPKITPFLYCRACHERVDRPTRCPRCSKKPGYPRLMFIGPPGEVWISNSERVLYQMIPGFHKGSGACFQYASCLGPFWGIPFCQGCDCRQIAVAPGGQSLPFVDYLEEVWKLSLVQKYAMLGKGNWELLKAGLVTWSDVVTPYSVREFHEVMDRKKLTVRAMIEAGVPAEDVKAAWDLVYTPERLAADAKRSEAIRGLRELGLSTEDIARMISLRLAGRVSQTKSDQ
jgi:hypothetical protein